MYLRHSVRLKSGKRHVYWRLVRSVRRSDCTQVCIALVVTREGLPLGYEVFPGNRADVTTVEEIVEAMERRLQERDEKLGPPARRPARLEAGAC